MPSKLSTNDILNIQDYAQFTTEELISMRMKAAETVNRQMRRWDAAGLKDKPSAYTKYAKPYLRQFGRERFSTTAKPVGGRTDYQIRQKEIAELSAMARLKNAPTYTVAGYKKVKKKAIEGLARAAGIDLNSPEGKKFVEETAESLVGSDQWGWLKRTVGSDVLLKVSKKIADGVATREEVLQRITEMRARDVAGRSYVDARGRVQTEETEKWGEVKTVHHRTGEVEDVWEHESSIYIDRTEDEVMRELGFSQNPNWVYEEYGEDD